MYTLSEANEPADTKLRTPRPPVQPRGSEQGREKEEEDEEEDEEGPRGGRGRGGNWWQLLCPQAPRTRRARFVDCMGEKKFGGGEGRGRCMLGCLGGGAEAMPSQKNWTEQNQRLNILHAFLPELCRTLAPSQLTVAASSHGCPATAYLAGHSTSPRIHVSTTWFNQYASKRTASRICIRLRARACEQRMQRMRTG